MMKPINNLTVAHDKEDPDCYCELCELGLERKMIQSFSTESLCFSLEMRLLDTARGTGNVLVKCVQMIDLQPGLIALII